MQGIHDLAQVKQSEVVYGLLRSTLLRLFNCFDCCRVSEENRGPIANRLLCSKVVFVKRLYFGKA